MKIGHMALYVNDLEGAKEFFTEYFEAEAGGLYHNKNTGFKSYFLKFEEGASLEIMCRPDVAEREKVQECTGFSHIAINTGSKEAVDSLTARLEKDGFEVISGPRVTGDGYYESCVRAFEGNRVEITI